MSVRKIYFMYVGGIMMKMGMKKFIATAVAGVFFSGMPIGSSVSEASDWGKIAGDLIGSLLNSASNGSSSSSSGESSVNSILNLSSQKNAVMNPSSNDKLFMLAVKNGDTETAAQMLAQGVNVNGVFYPPSNYDWGTTALRTAMDNNNRPMMQFLLENGADVTGYHVYDRAYKKDYYISYIVIAAANADTELVTYLHNWGADISSKGYWDRDYYTPFTAYIYACWWSSRKANEAYALTSYLLSQGANIDEPLVFHKVRYTPFLLAVDWKWYEMVDILADNGANIYAKDSRGRNALKIALDKEDLQLYKHVQDLMNRGQQAR